MYFSVNMFRYQLGAALLGAPGRRHTGTTFWGWSWGQDLGWRSGSGVEDRMWGGGQDVGQRTGWWRGMRVGGWVGGWERGSRRVGAEVGSVDGDLMNESGLWIRSTKG